MSRVEIHTTHVVVEGTEPAADLVALAERLWQHRTPDRPGMGAGFTTALRTTADVRPTSHDRYGRPPMAPVTAQHPSSGPNG